MNDILINLENAILKGILTIAEKSKGLVLFAHGSGSSRLSTRNQFVASELQKAGFATLLMDLLTEDEDQSTRNRFDIELLTLRLIDTTQWCLHQKKLKKFKVHYFGASTGAASALKACTQLPYIRSVVSRGGRADLALNSLHLVKAPTLLIVGSLDDVVIELNEQAFQKLKCEKKMEIVHGATHLFEEPGTLEKVAELAKHWFLSHS